MMYRCGWATKDANQARVLAIHLRREAFEDLLRDAWPSSFGTVARARFQDSADAWSAAKHKSKVVMQWDPDHNPNGYPLQRRAIQLGIRPEAVAATYLPGIAKIEDVTEFVVDQSQHRKDTRKEMVTPVETPYVFMDPSLAQVSGIETQ